MMIDELKEQLFIDDLSIEDQRKTRNFINSGQVCSLVQNEKGTGMHYHLECSLL